MRKMLFVLGVIKGGTTWVNWAVNCHPGVVSPPRKEFHYFLRQYGNRDRLTDKGRYDHFLRAISRLQIAAEDDSRQHVAAAPPAAYDEELQEYLRRVWRKGGQARARYRRATEMIDWYKLYLNGPVNDDWYRSLFQSVPDDKWAVDASTTGYMIPPDGMKAMADFYPVSRAMLILRNPIDRLWSHTKFQAAQSGKKQEFSTWNPDQIVSFSDKFNLHKSSLYAPGVRGLLDGFKADNRLIMSFNDVANRPDDLFRDLLKLLELEDIPLPKRQGEDQVINRSASVKMPPGLFSSYVPEFLADLEELDKMGIRFVRPWIEDVKNHAMAKV